MYCNLCYVVLPVEIQVRGSVVQLVSYIQTVSLFLRRNLIPAWAMLPKMNAFDLPATGPCRGKILDYG